MWAILATRGELHFRFCFRLLQNPIVLHKVIAWGKSEVSLENFFSRGMDGNFRLQLRSLKRHFCTYSITLTCYTLFCRNTFIFISYCLFEYNYIVCKSCCFVNLQKKILNYLKSKRVLFFFKFWANYVDINDERTRTMQSSFSVLRFRLRSRQTIYSVEQKQQILFSDWNKTKKTKQINSKQQILFSD